MEWLGKGVRHAFSDEKWKAKLKPLPNLWWEGLSFSMIVLEINLEGLVNQQSTICAACEYPCYESRMTCESPKVLVESHITSPWHLVFRTKVNTVWLFRA